MQLDIALAPLSDSYWKILVERANKLAVDLDQWQEPAWQEVRYCLATGYLNEHKITATRHGTDYIETPFARAIAELTSTVTGSSSSFQMYSRLERPADVFLSGISGGLAYAINGGVSADSADDGDLFPAGIVHEGWPSARNSADRDESTAILDDRDLLVRATRLSPEKFDDWLSRCQLE